MAQPHTLGPWMSGGCVVWQENGGPIADLVSGICRFNRNHDVTEANARLIAAAPDLLAACEAVVLHIEDLEEAWRRGVIAEHDGRGGTRSNRNADCVRAIRAAIAKAKERIK